MTKTFDTGEYERRFNEFPDITYEEYKKITDEQVRQEVAKENKILQTDTYNRTMNYIEWYTRLDMIETFTSSMKRAPEWSAYIVDWIGEMIKNLFWTPITQRELDFVKDFYADQWRNGEVWYLDVDVWQKVVDNWWYIPFIIRAVPDWTLVHPWEPVVTLTYIL